MKYTPYIILVLIVLAGCQTAPVTDEIQVGALFALTNYGSVTGVEEHRALQLAVEQQNAAGGINGRQIVLTVEDTQTDQLAAVNGFNKLVNIDKIQYIFGPTWEASTASVVPAAENQDVLLLATSSYDTVKNSDDTEIFALYPPYEYEIQGLLPYFESKEYTRYGVLHNEEYYGNIMKDLFVETIEGQGWQVVEVLSSPEEDNDFRTQLIKLDAQNLDVIYTPVDYPMIGELAQQAKELGVQAQIVGLYTTENPRLVPDIKEYMEAVVYARPVPSEQYDAFAQAYLDRWGEVTADPAAEVTYDAAQLLFAALESGAETPEDISAYLYSLEDYEGVSNTITFTEQGIVGAKPYVPRMIVDGEFLAAI